MGNPVSAMNQYDSDAYAVLNWLLKYYERRGMFKQYAEIRAQLDRLTLKHDQAHSADNVIQFGEERLEA